MVRALFGGGVGDQVFGDIELGSRNVYGHVTDVNGDDAPVTLTVWSARTGGTQYTDLLDADSDPITEVVTDAGTGYVPEFYGPDGVTTVYVRLDPAEPGFKFATGPAGPTGPPGGGDFYGPASSVTDNLVGFNDTTGKVGKDSGLATSTIATLAGSQTLTNKTVSGSSNTLTNLPASNLSSGTVPTARLGSGTADSTTFLRGDQTWATPAGGGSILSSRLTSAATNSTTTYAASGLSVTVAAATAYHIRVQGTYQSASTTTGFGIRLNGTATATALRAWSTIWGHLTNASTPTKLELTALAGAHLTTATFSNVTDLQFEIEGVIRVNAGGTLILEFASEIAASQVTIQADSSMVLTPLA